MRRQGGVQGLLRGLSQPARRRSPRSARRLIAACAAMSVLTIASALLPRPVMAQAGATGPAVAASPLAAGLPASAHSAAVATEWFSLALLLAQQTPGQSPPVAARALAYLSLALYESIVPGMPLHRSHAGLLNELSSLPAAQPDEVLHWPTVANAALATMTRMMFANASAEHRTRIDLLERGMALKHPQDFDPAQVPAAVGQRSQTHGRLIAMALMTWARTDGGHDGGAAQRRNRVAYVPPSGPGQWSPTPPDFAPALLPWWGGNRTFVLKSGADCPAPPPPAYSDAADSPFHREALEVHRIATAATQEQRQYALYWADDPGKTPTPAGHWVHIATDQLRLGKATLAIAAETYARLTQAMSDAFVAAWHAKYRLNLLRPVTYIQQAIDSGWAPSLMNTPPFPEFPSGHSVQSRAAAVVLASLFGAQTAFTDNTHNDRGWGPRRFPSFGAAAEEAALSRLYAGIHFRAAVELGQRQGQCVGDAVLALPLRR